MEELDFTKEKLELAYPSPWEYKLIGYTKEAVKEAVDEILEDKAYTFKESNVSSSGKYVSFNLEMIVCSEEERSETYNALKAHAAIKMVL